MKLRKKQPALFQIFSESNPVTAPFNKTRRGQLFYSAIVTLFTGVSPIKTFVKIF
jgi:hypothetical protein